MIQTDAESDGARNKFADALLNTYPAAHVKGIPGAARPATTHTPKAGTAGASSEEPARRSSRHGGHNDTVDEAVSKAPLRPDDGRHNNSGRPKGAAKNTRWGESQRAKRIARRERIQCLHDKLHDMLRALPGDKYTAAMDEINDLADTRWPAQRKIIRRALAAHNKTAKLATMEGEWAGRRDILAAALDKCDARSLVVEINGDAKHRSHITSFTSDHALLQTLTMWHFYSNLLEHDHLA